MSLLSTIKSWLPRAISGRSVPLRARYDAAQTTSENSAHWAWADSMGAATANSEVVRKTLRNRARYERANNCFASGMIRTVAEHVIGTGPRLQCQTDNEEHNQIIEAEWERWARRINLADKLRTMRMAKCCDGEAFAMLTSNPAINVDVTLDVQLIECDQIQSPGLVNNTRRVDGIEFDQYGNPKRYYLLEGHPGDSLAFVNSYIGQPVPAESILHWFRRDRPGQVRGVPEITPALPLYAVLRRYTLAVLHSAETAANFAAVLKTMGQIDPAEVDAWESLALERNGMMTLPDGWEVQQLKAEQPTTAHDAFQRSLLREIARCMGMPYNIAAGDSSSYNYSSGKLDDQTWGRTCQIDRTQCEIEILDRIRSAWKEEAELFGLIPKLATWRHAWQWPPAEDIDPNKEASAAASLKAVGLLTDADYFSRRQRDWREVYRQRKREQDFAAELGLQPAPDAAPAASTNTAQVQTVDGETIDVAAAGGVTHTFGAGAINLTAIAADGALPTFEMVAYTGGKLFLAGRTTPIVLDLQGTRAQADVMPALRDHKLDQEIGHIPTFTNDGREIRVAGVLSAANEHQRRVVEAARNGFAWQASVGGSMGKIERVEAGRSVVVNGQSFAGPIDVAREVVIQEVSFVSLGADITGTTVAVAAISGGSTMDPFETYCKEKGIDPATVPDAIKADIMKMLEASASTGATNDQKVACTATPGVAPQTVTATATLDFTQSRQAMAEEMNRVAKIQALSVTYPAHAQLCATAITSGMSAVEVENQVLKAQVLAASRPAGPGIHVADDAKLLTPVVLKAAACQALRLENIESDPEFTPQVLQAAHSAFRGRIGLQDLMSHLAAANGYVPKAGGFRSNGREILRAAFSSTEASNILSNIANKFLLEGYSHVEDSWSKIAATRSVNDFKTVTSYRLVGAQDFEQVAPDGKLRHGKIADQSYTNQVKTYGKMFAITRTDMINDDLGALQNIPKMIGRGGALKLNDVFWTEFVAGDGTFWHTAHSTAGDTGNSNKTTGAFASSTLATAEALFMNQVDPYGKPISVEPKLLLVPPALKRKAMELMGSAFFVSGNTTKEPSANTFQNAYDIVVSTYLQNASYGNSAVIYYLLADPRDLPVIEVAFLNGQQSPTVEEVDVDSDMLGMSFRGYFDFGVSKQDYRGGVKSTGA